MRRSLHYLCLLLVVLGLLFSIWFTRYSQSDPEAPAATPKSLLTLDKDGASTSILSGSVRTRSSERERLLSITDPDAFYGELVSYFLSQDSATFTPLQQKAYTCQQIFLQIENGGVTAMLYNADQRSQWCALAATYCREFQAFTSAEAFESLSAIFAEMEAQDLSQVKTWGDYLAHAKQFSPLEELMAQMAPHEDLLAPLVAFVYEHREALLTFPEQAHSEEVPSL